MKEINVIKFCCLDKSELCEFYVIIIVCFYKKFDNF